MTEAPALNIRRNKRKLICHYEGTVSHKELICTPITF